MIEKHCQCISVYPPEAVRIFKAYLEQSVRLSKHARVRSQDFQSMPVPGLQQYSMHGVAVLLLAARSRGRYDPPLLGIEWISPPSGEFGTLFMAIRGIY